MPVTTPTAKLTAKILAQNVAADSYWSLGLGLAPEREGVILSTEVGHRLQPRDEQRDAHRQDREQVVERDGERELQTVHRHMAAHQSLSSPPGSPFEAPIGGHATPRGGG
jgi:hypothetical protein